MKIVIAGGTGQIGTLLQQALIKHGHEVTVLSRHTLPVEQGIRYMQWDGRTLGPWAQELDGAGAVINLAGRSVSCRYTDEHLKQMMNSRVESTRAVGKAIAAATNPPAVWLQMSTATIYADTRTATNDEATGTIGGNESDVPAYWEYSVRIARNWEAAQLEADLPNTRRVALRSAMVMTADQGGIFDVLLLLTRLGLGGPVAGGQQRVSWITGDDFIKAVTFLLEHDEIDGPVNLAAPNPVPQSEFMQAMRQAWGAPVGLPATKSMAKLGAWVLRSDAELLLKSRSVVPGRLLAAGFTFKHPDWKDAANYLVQRTRSRPEGTSKVQTARHVLGLNKAK